MTAAEIGDGNGLSFQIAERADAVDADQFYATRMKTRQNYYWVPVVHLGSERPTEMRSNIDFIGGKSVFDGSGFDVLHIGKTLTVEGILRHIQGRVTKAARVVSEPDFCGFRRRLRGDCLRAQPKKDSSSGESRGG
jgi:inorganic pyrophosphatase